MSEQVFRIVQVGLETTVGTAVAATVGLPLEAATIELDRASQYAAEDYGRSVRNHASRGYHGMRGASMPFTADVRFEDIMKFFEMQYSGGVTPSGVGPYVWTYPFEGGASTRKSYTIEEGAIDNALDQWIMPGTLIDDMTLEYDALAAPGASPWHVSGTMMGMDRSVRALTAALAPPATLETVMGHLSIIKEGTTGTAFASLTELSASLVRFHVQTNRNLVRRAYGSTSDIAQGWGYSDKGAGSFEAMLKIGATAKSDALDIWNASGGSLGERRWRIEAIGSGTKKLQLDFRTGFTKVGIDTRDGERVYMVSGELVDDTTLAAPITAIVTNSVATQA